MESRKRCYLGVGLHAEPASGQCRVGGGPGADCAGLCGLGDSALV